MRTRVIGYAVKIGTDYYHPENLHTIYSDLPAASSALSVDRVRVLSSTLTGSFIAIEYGGIKSILHVRKAYESKGGPLINDSTLADNWIVSQYVYDDNRMIGRYIDRAFGYVSVGGYINGQGPAYEEYNLSFSLIGIPPAGKICHVYSIHRQQIFY